MFFVIGVIREPIHVHQLIWYSVFSFNWLFFSWKSQMFAHALPDNCLQTRPLGESRQLLLFAHGAVVFLLLTKLQFSHVPNNKQLQLSLLHNISLGGRTPGVMKRPAGDTLGQRSISPIPTGLHFRSSRAGEQNLLVAPDAWTMHQHQWPPNETGNAGPCLHSRGYF